MRVAVVLVLQGLLTDGSILFGTSGWMDGWMGGWSRAEKRREEERSDGIHQPVVHKPHWPLPSSDPSVAAAPILTLGPATGGRRGDCAIKEVRDCTQR
jgi:hypothetical protein